MTDQRLADISLLSLERDLTFSTTFLEDTVRAFEGIDKNRTIILSSSVRYNYYYKNVN